MKSNFQHIIMISLDSLREDCITCFKKSKFVREYGIKNFNTKILDEVISKGVYFTNCFSSAPYTSSSHAAYFTGDWPRKNGVYEFFNRKISVPTIFELAKKSGFDTIFQTDFPIILGKSIGFDNGVDNYYIEDELSALNKLKELKNKKTLAFFHFGGIHYPYGFHKLKFAPKDYPRKVKELEKKYNLKKNDKFEDMLDESYRDEKDKDYLFRYKRIIDYLSERNLFSKLNELYLEGIQYFLNNRFKKFFNELMNFVENNNAILILFSDHGEHWSINSKGHANSISEKTLRVPLLLYSKNIRPKVVSRLVRTIDVAPTIISLTDINGIKMDGTDLFSDKGERYSLSQVWRVGNKGKIMKHQKKILKKGKMIAPLKTRLEKEMICLGKYCLINIYSKSGNLVETLNFLNSGEEFLEKNIPLKNKKLMIKILKKYNKQHSKKNLKLKRINRSIKEDLNLLGYQI